MASFVELLQCINFLCGIQSNKGIVCVSSLLAIPDYFPALQLASVNSRMGRVNSISNIAKVYRICRICQLIICQWITIAGIVRKTCHG